MTSAKDICARFEDSEMMKTINDLLFTELKECMATAPNLIIDVAPLGKFYYRKVKLGHRYKKENIPENEKKTFAKVLDMYEQYDADKLNLKYENFGKETHEAYLLAKKEKRIQKFQTNKFKQHNELLPGGS